MAFLAVPSGWPMMTVGSGPLGAKLVLGVSPPSTTDYFVDSVSGADNNPGTSPRTAWKSLDKTNATTFHPGDRILLKSGSVWTGQLWPKGSGSADQPIIIDKYGGNAKPIINGAGEEDAVEYRIVKDFMDALGKRRRQIAGTLSGGEQQMVSLARGLILNPSLIVADELSLGLAPLMVDAVFDGLARARAQGVTIVLIEQFVHRALAFADDCAVISRGRTVWSGPAGEAKDEVLRRYLGAAAA